MARVPNRPLKLTRVQQATLAWVAMHCEITLYGHRKGSLSLKKLVELGLLRVDDTSYGNYKQTSWTPTPTGHAYVKTLDNHGVNLMGELGWLDEI